MTIQVQIAAVIFDLDGVVTDTARAHVQSWKELFDAYLKSRHLRFKEPYVPFDPKRDYLDFVDGKPRYQGVKSFLSSRNLEIPFGNPSDPPDRETICGLGNKKNLRFQEIIRKQGVEVYPSSVNWIHLLKAQGIAVGMATSSKNGSLILNTAGLTDLFDAKVDGIDSARLGLKGKPNPDIFWECAKRLKTEPSRAAVVEDAIAGVQAGKKGGFGLVIGMARANPKNILIENGADLAVENLMDISLSQLG